MDPVEAKCSQPESRGRQLTPESRLLGREGVVLRHVAGEHMLVPSVIRGVDLESLFLLNSTGVYVWERLDGQRRIRDLAAAVAEAFAIESAAAVADVTAFLADLLARNLAEFAGGNGA